jgi:predicted ATPase/DNA-binding winged helix-turn-helix (wHTH) protein
MPPDEKTLRFGRFELNPAERVLRVDGAAAAIGARAFDLLLVLAERRDRLVTKQELLDLVWPGVVVEEHNIATQISSLRKLLGAQVITTVPGRGYRFSGAALDAAAGPSSRHALPQPRTRFIGREDALADLARLLPQVRLVTLTGIGGSGKTRLALQFARTHASDYADGACFVDLSALRDSARVPAACAVALGLDAAGADEALAELLAAHLAERELLLVLDNCEQVRDGAAALVDALLARESSTRILATSREPLAVVGEQLYPVRALSLPATSDLAQVLGADAVRVFVDRARLVSPGFELGAHNAAAVGEICRRLDGIALAIELAAARVTVLSVDEIVARLGDRFRLLTGGHGSALRQQTLLAAMQWSYDQLADAEQRLLRLCATFAGGWTLQAASALAQTTDDYETLALLTRLHDKSLLVADPGGDGPRFHMLETVRDYAQRQLDAAGETADARTRHAEYFLVLTEAAAPHLRGPEQPQWMARLRAEQENLLAALQWCSTPASPVDERWALRLATSTARYWLFNEIDLGRRLLQAALERDRDAGDSEVRFAALHALAGMHMHAGDTAGALLHGRAALALARRMGWAEQQAKALTAIGSALHMEGDNPAARRHEYEAMQLAEASGNVEYMATLSNNLAETERARGELALAERGYVRALKLARAQGNLLLAAIVLHNLVRLCVAAGRHADARAYAAESEQLLRGLGEQVLKMELLKVCAGLAASLGEPALAARWWGAGQPRFIAAGYRDPQIDVTQMDELLGRARQLLGEADYDAAEAAGRTLELGTAMDELRRWLV